MADLRGAGIGAEWLPRREWDETMNKGRAIFRAVSPAENGLNHLSKLTATPLKLTQTLHTMNL